MVPPEPLYIRERCPVCGHDTTSHVIRDDGKRMRCQSSGDGWGSHKCECTITPERLHRP